MPADRDLPEKNLVDYVAVLWRRKFTILLTVVVAVAIAIGIDFARTKQYTSTAALLLTIPGISANSSTAQAYATQPNVPTDIELIQSAQVQDAVTKKIGSAPGVAVTQVGTTNVVDISATSPDPDEAAKVANAYATSYLEVSSGNYLSSINAQVAQYQSQINGLQTQIDQINGQLSDASGTNASNLESQLTSLLAQQQSVKTALASLQQSAANASGGQVVTPATPSSSPSSPKRTRDALIALAGGLLLGLGLALLRDYFDDRIRSREDLEEAVPTIPIVGMIPEVSDWRNRRKPFLVELARPRSPAAEAYRSLRTSIQFMSLDHPVKLLQITSGAASEGKTTTSANLAVAMAEAGTQVVLISCDLRKPRIHEFFDLPNGVGLTSVLLGNVELHDALQSVPGVPNLTLLGSGPVPPNPSELLSGRRAGQVFADLTREFEVVLLDSSPLLPVTDGSILAGLSDAVLLVAAADYSTKRDVGRSLESLSRVSANVVGLVLNRASSSDSYVYYRYGYGYGSGPNDALAPSDPAATNTPPLGTNGARNGRTTRGARHAR
jgi:polysaccharide biosynthesis transport protein